MPRPADVAGQVSSIDRHRQGGLAERHPGDDLAQQPGERAFQVTHAGLTGVLSGERVQDVVADRHVVDGEPGAVELTAQQMLAGDDDLLVLGVAVEPDELHPVEQRRRDRLQHVRRGQEQHVGQVEIHLQVMVPEGVVLLGVEDLQQRRRWVPPVVGAQLVDLVEQHHRVHRARFADRPDDAAGQRADVGPPVTADLRLVPHAAEGDPDERPAHGPGDRFAE